MSTTWEKVVIGSVTKANWEHLLCTTIAVDAYLVWADASEFDGFGRTDDFDPRTDPLPILVELVEDNAAVPIDCRPGSQDQADPSGCDVAFGLFAVQSGYTQSDKNRVRRADWKFITGRVRACNVPALLLCREGVKRFQLGLPRLMDMEAGTVDRREPAQAAGNGRSQVVMGVIDDGCAFAHEQFLTPVGGTRVEFMWDQNESSDQGRGGKASRPFLFGYGAELTKKRINSVIQSVGRSASPYSPLEVYRQLNYVPLEPHPFHPSTIPRPEDVPLTMRQSLHGASVMALAAARDHPQGTFRAYQGYGPRPEHAAANDSAEAWPIVFVQLPTRTVLDTSGGSLGVHVLDGIRYIVRRAKAIARADAEVSAAYSVFREADETEAIKPLSLPAGQALSTAKQGSFEDNRVIITLSYSAIAGPHDGTSMLEMALAEVVKRERHVWVVLAAGNSHGALTHARAVVRADGKRKRFTWFVGPDNPLEAYLEVWLPDRTIGAPNETAGIENCFTLTVTPPGMGQVCTVTVGDAQVLRSAGRVVAGVVFCRKVAQGNKGTMVLIAVRPTAPREAASPFASESTRVPAPYGEWTVDVAFGLGSSLRSTDAAVVHAWAERNDRLYGTPRRQQSHVVSDDTLPDPTEFSPSTIAFCAHAGKGFMDEAPKPFQPELSFGSLGTSKDAGDLFFEADAGRGKVVVVGGYRSSDGEMSPYSAGGPARGSRSDNSRFPGGYCSDTPSAFTGDATRASPDVDAVSDTGLAVRGVRTVGMTAGRSARLSGTSAAAPTVARMIAQAQFQKLVGQDLKPRLSARPDEPANADPSRPTATPSKDDRFRRGRWRVEP